MKNFNKKLAVMILKNTTAYSLDQIGFSTLEHDRLIIWSSGGDGSFHSTEIIQLFAHPFSKYIQYNADMERCELIIF